jgi:hypothetical protein
VSYTDHRPALRLSSLPATRVDFLSTGKIWLACPRCSRWVTTASKKGRVIATHRGADNIARCKYSGLRLEVDLSASEHVQRRALAVAEAGQRRAVYSNRRAHAEPRVPVPGPLHRRPGGATPAQKTGWSGLEAPFTDPGATRWAEGESTLTDPGETWNNGRRIVRAARTA